ncbi:MAG: hypothetical protein HOQ12_02780 [Gemmatimonadaceae bacterium]|nr:hypothetical protein [Gemmatimonadaceae bacterium]
MTSTTDAAVAAGSLRVSRIAISSGSVAVTNWRTASIMFALDASAGLQTCASSESAGNAIMIAKRTTFFITTSSPVA